MLLLLDALSYTYQLHKHHLNSPGTSWWSPSGPLWRHGRVAWAVRLWVPLWAELLALLLLCHSPAAGIMNLAWWGGKLNLKVSCTSLFIKARKIYKWKVYHLMAMNYYIGRLETSHTDVWKGLNQIVICYSLILVYCYVRIVIIMLPINLADLEFLRSIDFNNDNIFSRCVLKILTVSMVSI